MDEDVALLAGSCHGGEVSELTGGEGDADGRRGLRVVAEVGLVTRVVQQHGELTEEELPARENLAGLVDLLQSRAHDLLALRQRLRSLAVGDGLLLLAQLQSEEGCVLGSDEALLVVLRSQLDNRQLVTDLTHHTLEILHARGASVAGHVVVLSIGIEHY